MNKEDETDDDVGVGSVSTNEVQEQTALEVSKTAGKRLISVSDDERHSDSSTSSKRPRRNKKTGRK